MVAPRDYFQDGNGASEILKNIKSQLYLELVCIVVIQPLALFGIGYQCYIGVFFVKNVLASSLFKPLRLTHVLSRYPPEESSLGTF